VSSFRHADSLPKRSMACPLENYHPSTRLSNRRPWSDIPNRSATVLFMWFRRRFINCYPGSTLPWMDAVVHSQGTLQAPRRQLIQEELTRIDTYQKKGDLARFEDVLDYLNRRDMGSTLNRSFSQAKA
jgi:hypothetical protein